MRLISVSLVPWMGMWSVFAISHSFFLSEVGKFGDVFIVCVDVWIVNDVDLEVEVVGCSVWF